MTFKQKNLVLDDLAAELGLSKSTVSRAISGNGRVSEETRKRVLDYAELHGYMPNGIASSLARSRTDNIAVVMPTEAFQNEIPFFQGCLMGVCEAAAKRGYDVLVATVGETDVSALKRIISNRKADGILLTRSLVTDYPADFLKNAHVPFVTVGSSSDERIVQVDTDTLAACRDLTLKVLSQTRGRVALIVGNLRYIVNKNRYDGFAAAFLEAKRPLEEALVYTDVDGGKAVREACQSAVEAGAEHILCGDDYICVKAVEQLGTNRDVHVSSFYNSDPLKNLPQVNFVVDVDVRSYGVLAGETLINLLEREPVPQKTFVPHQILTYHES
ncbi:MAG TPA: LacI family DNA-binding transcriptional regulator [Clostridia bacterium]|nr:LacI family DNA-binding transcriptional regulator [Clostridia bacterium]